MITSVAPTSDGNGWHKERQQEREERRLVKPSTNTAQVEEQPRLLPEEEMGVLMEKGEKVESFFALFLCFASESSTTYDKGGGG